jgi:hypothetical protein
VAKYDALKLRIRELFEKGYSRYQIKEMYEMFFKEEYPTLKKKYFNELLSKISKDTLVVKESVNGSIKYEFKFMQSNEDHLGIIVDMFVELLDSSDIDSTNFEHYDLSDKKSIDVLQSYGNPLVESFIQTKTTNDDNTVSYEWVVKTNNDFQKNKILSQMSDFIQREKINVVKI